VGKKLSRVGTFSQITMFFFLCVVCTSGPPTIPLYFLGFFFIFLAHVFNFWLVERLAQVTLEANHTLLQTDNPVWCKVFIFSVLYGDSAQGKGGLYLEGLIEGNFAFQDGWAYNRREICICNFQCAKLMVILGYWQEICNNLIPPNMPT